MGIANILHTRLQSSTVFPSRVVAAGLIVATATFAAHAQSPPAQSPTPIGDVPAHGVVEDHYGDVGRMKLGEPTPAAKDYSPYAGRKYPIRPFFGDTHLHSANSGDAFGAGNRFTPEETYRIARGEEVVSTTTRLCRHLRPLRGIGAADTGVWGQPGLHGRRDPAALA